MSLPNNISHVKLPKQLDVMGAKATEMRKNKKNYEANGRNQLVAMLAMVEMGRRKIYNILPTIMLLCERALISPARLCPRAIFFTSCRGFGSTLFCNRLEDRLRGREAWEAELFSVLSRRITYIIDTLTLPSNCEGRLQGWSGYGPWPSRILVLFKMALNHGSRLAQENAETGTHTTRNRMCSRLKG